MTLRPLVPALAVAVPLVGCATARPSPAPARLDAATLCGRITSEACSPTARTAAPEDLATLVLGTISERDAAFAAVLDGMAKIAPADRKAALVKAVSDAGGAPWSCAAFDTLWASQPVSCQ